MRIALTHAFCWPEVRRGAERFVPSLGAALARRGHEVVHFSAAWAPGETVEDGVRTVRLRRRLHSTYGHEMDFAARLLPLLARQPFDAVHSLGRWDAMASIASARIRRDGRRTMITDLGLPDPVWWRQQGRVQAWAAASAIKHIDIYSAMSRTAVQRLASGYGRTDGVVVPGGVDTARFRPQSERAPAPVVLFSGAIAEARKGVPVLLNALPAIAAIHPDVELWLSGPGDATAFVAAAPPGAAERVRMLGLGESDRQQERYGRAWVTCLPSVDDSFGMALIESLACGTPLVVTTNGAPQELVQEHVTGELCQPKDPESLAQACLRGFELARRSETVEACRAASAQFDWDRGLAPLCERLYSGKR